MQAPTRLDDPIQAGNGRAARSPGAGGVSLAAQAYEELLLLRAEQERRQARYNELLAADLTDQAIDFELTDLSPALESVIEKEEEILSMRTRSMLDLVVKVLVCSENDFSFEVLNEMLGGDARYMFKRHLDGFDLVI